MLKNEFRSANFKLRNNSMTDLQKGRPEHTTIAIQNGGSKEDSESRKHLVVLGISLDSLPRATQFLVCCGGVFLFYLIYGYVQVRNRYKIINSELKSELNHHWSADLTVWFVFLQTSIPCAWEIFSSLSPLAKVTFPTPVLACRLVPQHLEPTIPIFPGVSKFFI